MDSRIGALELGAFSQAPVRFVPEDISEAAFAVAPEDFNADEPRPVAVGDSHDG